MNKAELILDLQEKYQNWQALLDQIGPARRTDWNRWLVVRLQAAQRGEPEPPPPWPVHLQAEDDINAWIYESNRGRSVREVQDESRQGFQQLFAVLESLPDDVRIEFVEPKFHIVWLDEEYFPPGEFFDHFHDDHEPDVRAWLARVENVSGNPTKRWASYNLFSQSKEN